MPDANGYTYRERRRIEIEVHPTYSPPAGDGIRREGRGRLVADAEFDRRVEAALVRILERT